MVSFCTWTGGHWLAQLLIQSVRHPAVQVRPNVRILARQLLQVSTCTVVPLLGFPLFRFGSQRRSLRSCLFVIHPVDSGIGSSQRGGERVDVGLVLDALLRECLVRVEPIPGDPADEQAQNDGGDVLEVHPGRHSRFPFRFEQIVEVRLQQLDQRSEAGEPEQCQRDQRQHAERVHVTASRARPRLRPAPYRRRR